METKDMIFSAMMVTSAFVLTFRWLSYLENEDPVIYVSAMVLVGALAAMLLSADTRLRRIESEIEAKERSLRINIQGVEENIDRKMDVMIDEVRTSRQEIAKRSYR